MLKSLSRLTGALITGIDGDIGHVRETLFDDDSRTLRYLIVETGDWLNGRSLLLSTQSVRQAPGSGTGLQAGLDRQQLHSCPPLHASHALTRLQERRLLRHYGLTEYWSDGSSLAFDGDDQQLRCSSELRGYEIQACDADIGHLRDFIYEDVSWELRFLVVDTSGWWKDGQLVMVAVPQITRIDLQTRQLQVRLNRDRVKSSPLYEEADSPPPAKSGAPLRAASYWM